MPSLPKAKVPLYPKTIDPADPGRQVMSVGLGLGEVGVVGLWRAPPEVTSWEAVTAELSDQCHHQVSTIAFRISLLSLPIFLDDFSPKISHETYCKVY